VNNAHLRTLHRHGAEAAANEWSRHSGTDEKVDEHETDAPDRWLSCIDKTRSTYMVPTKGCLVARGAESLDRHGRQHVRSPLDGLLAAVVSSSRPSVRNGEVDSRREERGRGGSGPSGGVLNG
jgi:hypothetical protein